MRDHRTIDEIIKQMISFSYDENEYSSLNSLQLKQDPRFIDPNVYLGYNALYDSAYKCKLGVMWKNSVVKYMLNVLLNTFKLHNELVNGKYKPMPLKKFQVTSPKPREIVSVMFRDRIYQRSMCDNAIYPLVIRHLIYDNAACQRGKGTKFARDRLICHMQKHYRKHGTNGYVVKVDVKGYYPNMSHEYVKSLFSRYFVGDLLRRIYRVLDAYEGNIGFNPGSQLIQIAGILVLNDIDHYFKERLKIKHYMRYMDDIIMFCKTKEEANFLLSLMLRKLNAIGFKLNEEKSCVFKLSKDVLYLGFKFHLTENGKVVINILSPTVKRYKKKIVRLIHLNKSPKKLNECLTSWFAHVNYGNTYKVKLRMLQFYKRLYELFHTENKESRGN